ncbi:MAG: hypothetical protein SPL10_01755 [Synergistales bacterium]|nr:hypothetical protein [Synergistales bacterium]MDY6402091.1 hypothetical protein [Synergistales bacterium]MDY6405248.1 hypothetical protein [Synergistales bacterium]MDY6410964.1 hypothetical protein [Synergistales bacterium]MDY6413867.1 hypothetical protein [Synergistales bacterium]
MQPVSMLMSNLNVEANTHHAPNALAAAQDTGQSQEIIRDGIRIVQTVQASEAASEAQKVHRKNENDERGKGDNSRKKRDTFEITEKKEKEKLLENNNAPLIQDNNIKSKKSFEFYA